MNCNTTHYRANSSSVPGDPTGDYAGTWQTAAPLFRSLVAESEWVGRCVKIRKPLGKVIARQLKTSGPTGFGRLFKAQFATHFDGGFDAVETVTFSRQADGSWQAFTYIVRIGTALARDWKRAFWIILTAFILVTAIITAVGIGVTWINRTIANHSSPAMLADRPEQLRGLFTDRLIEVGLSKPLSPWAWQELEKRDLTREQAGRILEGATAWLQQDYPNGPSEPLSWFDTFLNDLDLRQLVTEQQKIAFVQAVHGHLRGPTAMRIREGASSLDVRMECRYRWSQSILHLVMLNEVQATTVDGQPVKLRPDFGRSWHLDDLNETLALPALAPGKHHVTIDVLSALVPKEDVEGMAADAPAADWPPAVKRWTRTFEMELEVYQRDAVVVGQTQDPALNPQQHGFGIKRAVVRRKGGKPLLMVTFENTNRLPVDISFKVSGRVGGQTVSGGGLNIHTRGDSQSQSGMEQTIGIAELPRDTETADIMLTPDPAQVESNAEFKRIWGGEIIFPNVPLKRLDGTEISKPDFGPVIERVANAAPETEENSAIDLDNGKLVSCPPDLNGDDAEKTKTWVVANGVDAYAVYEPQEASQEGAELRDKWTFEQTGVHLPPGQLTGLGFYDAAVLADSNADWETITPDRLTSMLAQQPSRPWNYLPSKPDSTTTWLFKTREGGMGILQITGFTENPRGVKLRYKLVQPQPSAAMIEPAVTKAAPAQTATANPGGWIQEPDSGILYQVSRHLQLRPSTMVSNSVPSYSYGQDSCSGWGKTLKEMITLAWSQKNSKLKIVFPADLPDDRYDFIVARDPHWWDTLQAGLDRHFHLVETIENHNGTDVVVVKKQMQDAETTSVAPTPAPEIQNGGIQFINAPLAQVLEIYAKLTGAELEMDPRVQTLPATIVYSNSAPLTRTEAVRQLEEALRDQAGVVVKNRDANHISLRYCGLEFHWIASAGDSNSPAEALRDPADSTNQRTFRVLDEVVLDAAAIESAGLTVDQPERKEFSVVLTQFGAKQFAELTTINVGRQLAILWHGRLICAPYINSPITGGSIAITGRFTDSEAEQLLNAMNHREQKSPANQHKHVPVTPIPVETAASNVTEPADLLKAQAKLAELRVDYGESNPVIQRMLARIRELERMTKEEPAAPATLREAKAHLAELRVDYAEQNPRIQEALAQIKTIEAGQDGGTGNHSILAEQPPVVVETFPHSGARDVAPGVTELRVRFSKPMTENSWSWSAAREDSTPEFIGSPHYEADGRTCVAKVKLEPGKTYAFWLNSEKFLNFKDRDGRPAVPYLLIFQTKQQ